ncbi:MAG: DUF4345 domain-containing protein [Nannocystaceae bacterium]
MASSQILTRFCLWGNAIVFLAVGISFALFPTEMAAIVDIEAPSAAAKTDIRAVYGGLHLGLGIFFSVCTTYPRQAITGLRLGAVLLAAMAITRFAGIVLDGAQPTLTYQLWAMELLGATGCLLALRQHARARQP